MTLKQSKDFMSTIFMHRNLGKSVFQKIKFFMILLFFANFASLKKTPFLHFFQKVQKVRLAFPNIFSKNAQKIIIFVSDIVFCSQSKGKKISWSYLPNWRNEAQIPEKKPISPFFRTTLESLPNELYPPLKI